MDAVQGLAPGSAQCPGVTAVNVLLLLILTFITHGRPDRSPLQDIRSRQNELLCKWEQPCTAGLVGGQGSVDLAQGE